MFLSAFGRISTVMLLFFLNPCSAQKTDMRISSVQYSLPRLPPSTEGLALEAPTVGLFIGVTDYEPKSGLPKEQQKTLAHTLSAAVMHQAFFDGVTRSEEVERKRSLGIPDDNYLSIHTKPICSIAFSSDGSRVITGSYDGSAVVFHTSGNPEPIVLRHEGPVCAVAFSPDGFYVATGSEDGTARIWPAEHSSEPIVLRHPAKVDHVVFGSKGARLLTLATDNIPRIWSPDGTSSSLIPPVEAGCHERALIGLSPDGQTIAIAACGVVRAQLVESSSESTLLGKIPGTIESLAFSPDRTWVLTTGSGGTWLLPLDTGQKPVALETKPTAKAAFSSDSVHIATISGDGAVRLWSISTGISPTSITRLRQPAESVLVTADGRHVAIGSGGLAKLWDVGHDHSTLIPRPERPKTKNDEVQEYMAIEKGKLPISKHYWSIDRFAISPDGLRVVAGYHDGTVGILPGTDEGGRRAFRRDSLMLLADTRLLAKDPNEKLAMEMLTTLNAFPSFMTYNASPTGKDIESYEMGSGEPVTKRRILDALAASIRKADQVASQWGGVTLVVYISAHGWIGSDGRPYFLPSDTDATVPDSWIAHEDFLQPLYRFQGSAADGASPDPNEIQKRKQTIVIFDTCQQDGPASHPKLAAQSFGRPGLIVVEATSPGQYAWHWPDAFKNDAETWSRSTARFRLPKQKSSNVSQDIKTGMSIVPIASQLILNQFLISRSGSETKEAGVIHAGDWVWAISDGVGKIQKELPGLENVKGRHFEQQVQVQSDPAQWEYPLFRADAPKVKHD